MRILLSTLLLTLTPCLAGATELSFRFAGSLTSITDQYGFLSDQFSVGNPINGIITYQTNTPEGITSQGDPTFGIYSAINYFYVSINGFVFEGSPTSLPGYLQVWDDYLVNPSVVDAVTFSSPLDYSPPIAGMGPGTVVGGVDVYLFDFMHTASQNGKVIPSIITYENYNARLFSALQLNVDTQQAFFLNGKIDTITPVPEPSTAFLLLLGIPILVWSRSHRKEA